MKAKSLTFSILALVSIGCDHHECDTIPADFFDRISVNGPSLDDQNTDKQDPPQEPVPDEKTTEDLIFETASIGDLKGLQNYLEVDSARLNLTNDQNESLLIVATKFNQWTIVKYLLDLGIDTSIKDDSGFDAVYYAEVQGQDTLAALIKGELTQADKDNQFLEAVQEAKADEIKFLVEVVGADINAIDSNNRTALIIAIPMGQVDVIKTLLDLGIDTVLTVRGGRQMKASEYAIRVRANPEIIELLKEAEES